MTTYALDCGRDDDDTPAAISRRKERVRDRPPSRQGRRPRIDLRALRALKVELDPAAVMGPGKLLA